MLRWLVCRAEDVPADVTFLSASERERAVGLWLPKRRGDFVLGRWAAKQAVAATLGLPRDATALTRIELRPEPEGAPVVYLDGAPVRVTVSLSHRGGWGMCVVGPAASRVGCDLELVEPRSGVFVADWFTERERALVASYDDPRDAHVAANLTWSAKESALKALRIGLRRDTRSVEVSFPDRPVPGAGSWQPLRVRVAEGLLAGWWRQDRGTVCTVATDPDGEPPATVG